MKIIKVNTDKFYKQKYVHMDDAILDVDYAVNVYPKKKRAILKAANGVKLAKNVIKANYTAFPSSKKMVRKLLEKRECLYSALNLRKVVGEGADIVKAIILFNYLSQNVFYDMTSVEEVDPKENAGKNLKKNIDNIFEEYVKLKKTLKQTTCEEEKQKIQIELTKLAQEQMETNIELTQKNIRHQNHSYLKNLYNVLMRRKGVCSEFSYAYQFLLEGQNINSVCAGIYNKLEAFGHALNLVEYRKNSKQGYYIVDITEANSALTKSLRKLAYINSFAIPKSQFFLKEDGYDIVEVQYVKPIKTKTTEDFVSIIETKETIDSIKANILDDYIFEEEIKKAAIFIASGYKNYQEETKALTK